MTYSRKLAAALAASVCVVAIAAPAQAQVRQFNIGAGSLKSALDAWARQSGRQVIYKIDEVRSARSKGAKGPMSSDDALDAVLAGTGFNARKDTSGAVAVVRVSAAAVSGEVQAGSAPAHNESASDDERGKAEILVVGSRTMNVDIRRTADDPQPYIVFDSRDIQRSGAANFEYFLKQRLTANATSSTRSQSGFSQSLGTTSAINLRGLGANETLILVDGRRRSGISYAGTMTQPDINGIPMSAVERIEVLPSGASAIYGGAAMGGVINIILKKDFHGGDLNASYGNTASGSSRRWSIGGNYGFTLFGGDTRIMVGGQYADTEPLHLGDRQALIERGVSTVVRNYPQAIFTSSAPFHGATPNIASTPTFQPVPAGTPGAICLSATVCFGLAPPKLTLKAQFGGGALGSSFTWIPAGTASGSNISSALIANAGSYNLNLPQSVGVYGLDSAFGLSARTSSVFATLRQKVLPGVEFCADFSWNRNVGLTVSYPLVAFFLVP
jgi:iron complex outermembrane receptor protein